MIRNKNPHPIQLLLKLSTEEPKPRYLILRRIKKSIMDDPALKIEEAQKKYADSEKGKKAQKKWSDSPKGKKAQVKYKDSEKGQASQLKYRLSPKGKALNEKRKLISKVATAFLHWQKSNPEGTLETFLKEQNEKAVEAKAELVGVLKGRTK